ncbi:hypothetical protein FM104_07205 [Microbacterium esteraromaticum]|uniref:Uncharacterized protein n=1 Tax=Microbacterium esteraromaticum TaxID=57043 RepID=A0A1R4JFK1_9MICO|nr:hypothetical protein FM104_07205 [Microbacterium esteraromaticum]
MSAKALFAESHRIASTASARAAKVGSTHGRILGQMQT